MCPAPCRGDQSAGAMVTVCVREKCNLPISDYAGGRVMRVEEEPARRNARCILFAAIWLSTS